jgi:hypothetical protein
MIWSLTVIAPLQESNLSNPQIARMRVDLPEPEAPSKATVSPWLTEIETFFKAIVLRSDPENVLFAFSTISI